MHGLANNTVAKPEMIDPFGRTITYLRVSVTDRCDFRCVYCMSEDMTFLPKNEVLSLEELERLCGAFIDMGVRKIRITGGEPLVRRDIMELIQGLGQKIDAGALDELTLTTNASQLHRYSNDLVNAGVRRINVSLDTLDKDTFERITRRGKFDKVMAGIDAALDAGLKIKINAVALKQVNAGEFDHLVQWCGEKGVDLTLIETMPMGEITEAREDQYLPVSAIRDDLSTRWTLTPSAYRTGGPSRYFDVGETGQRVGFITPLSQNFCEGCNRVRLTCTGQLFMCLGQDDDKDLRAVLRSGANDTELRAAITEAITRKPKGHDFAIGPGRQPAVKRHMSVTGG